MGYLNDNAPKMGDKERRAFVTVFTRSAGGTGRSVEGYAAIFNSKTKIGGESWGYDEMIDPKAFDDAIDNSDCRALFNHDPNHLLARQSSGTLTLSLDSKGLKYAFEMPESRADLLEMMDRGDLKESSFAFTVKEEDWTSEKTAEGRWKYTRIIKRVEFLYDVSPVTYPAYTDTTVAKRSWAAWEAAQAPQTSDSSLDPAVLALIFG